MMKPMLAHKFDNSRVDWSQPVYIQPKLDGVRCLIKRVSDFPGQEELASFSVKAYSRTGKEFKNVSHITNALKGFFFNNPDVVLDGELYNHKLKNDFEKIISKYMTDMKYTDFANGETRYGQSEKDDSLYHAKKLVDILTQK